MKTSQVKRATICIAIVEDDPLRLVGLRSILDPVSSFNLKVMSTSAIALDQEIDLILIGNHSGLRFFDVMANLTSIRPELRIIVTGSRTDDETILKAIGAGAKGYVDEASPATELVRAIYAVHGRMIWAPRHVISMFIDRSETFLNPHLRPWGLTSREKQVLKMLVEGRSNKEIGAPLGIEERTVKAHVAKMMRKVGVRNRIALTVHAISHSLVPAQYS